MTKQAISELLASIDYVNQFRGKTFLIKLGGAILENATNLKHLCKALKLLTEVGIHIVIVHGGSTAINQVLKQHQIESTFVDGQRVTSLEAMNVIEMVLCGHVNKQIVRQLNHIGIQATGLSGSDNSMLVCDAYSHEHGYVGLIKSVNTQPIAWVMQSGKTAVDCIPIIAPIGVNEFGQPMNINADYAACELAIALQVDKLIYLTDQDGILDAHGKVISEISKEALNDLVTKQIVHGGMLTKSKAILVALNAHLNHVHVLNGNHPHALIQELFTTDGVGTLCQSHPILEAVL